jgi:Zn-dependent M28 family amino/carboxypeptidase
MSFSGMPGESYSGRLPPLTEEEEALAVALRTDVQQLSDRIGPRHLFAHDRLRMATEWIAGRFESSGRSVSRQTFHSFDSGGGDAAACENVEMIQLGVSEPDEIIVIGAHYDTVIGCPGANDNASGVAALLGLSAALANDELERTVRFVAFANEEHERQARLRPHGARRRRPREGRPRARGVGYDTDEPDSQAYPPPLGEIHPSIGNFVAFVGNVASRELVRRSVDTFRKQVQFPCEGEALPEDVPGVGWSDHWSFWQEGYPALMVTDTAPFRYPHYHLPTDTSDKLDYERMARVVAGLERVVRALAG